MATAIKVIDFNAGQSCPSEHEEQVKVVNWLRARGVLVFAIPNGGSRDKREAKRLKDEGVLAGVCDLFLPGYGLFVEMKRQRGGVVSDAQQKFMTDVEAIGYSCIVGYGATDAIDKLRQVL